MATWRRGDKGVQSPKIVGTPPKKTPRSYESHPGNVTQRYSLGGARVVKGKRREGVGAKNQDMRMKTPQR